MSLFTRRAPEKRAITDVPWVPFNVGGVYSPNGIDTERAMSLVPVFAAIRLLADDISTLPVCAYRQIGDVSQEISKPPLLVKPSTLLNTQEWLFACIVSLASWGNAYGLITAFDGYGYPLNIEWLNPSMVHVDESNPAVPRYFYNGRPLSPDEIAHLRWFVRPGRVMGFSPIDVLRSSLAVGLGAMDYKADWFANGGVPPGTFKNTEETVPSEEAETIKQRLVASIKRHEPIVHGNDWDYTSISLPADTAEFVGAMKLTATQVANVYGVPPSRIGGETGGSMTYSTTEMESLDFLVHSLRPWLVRIENALSSWLPNNVRVRFDTDELLRTDALSRWRIYQIQREIGATNVNEIREAEDLEPIPGDLGESYEPLPKAGIVPDTAHEIGDEPAEPAALPSKEPADA